MLSAIFVVTWLSRTRGCWWTEFAPLQSSLIMTCRIISETWTWSNEEGDNTIQREDRQIMQLADWRDENVECWKTTAVWLLHDYCCITTYHCELFYLHSVYTYWLHHKSIGHINTCDSVEFAHLPSRFFESRKSIVYISGENWDFVS